jgi:hypothetical protein
MKIDQSSVSLFSSHAKHDEVIEKESLKKWNRPEDNPEFANNNRGDKLVLSDIYKSAKQNKAMSNISDDSLESSIDPKLMKIIRALEMLIGHKIDTSFLRKIDSNGQVGVADKKSEGATDEAKPLGWGIDYSYQRTEIHEESLNFSAQGNVKTSDGRNIDFSMAMSMKSSMQISESLSFKAGDALTDPLVINFGTDTVSISDVKKDFDLNLDGKSDSFNFVGSGSGFLALDKNGDGKINDGSELFGPTKGNGFNELKAYDSDNNGWIDENDEVFKKLLIWTKDETGKENLYSLKQKDVGALYLNSAKTQFDLNGSTYNLQGVLRESSLFLKESGGVGTLQEVDLKA